MLLFRNNVSFPEGFQSDMVLAAELQGTLDLLGLGIEFANVEFAFLDLLLPSELLTKGFALEALLLQSQVAAVRLERSLLGVDVGQPLRDFRIDGEDLVPKHLLLGGQAFAAEFEHGNLSLGLRRVETGQHGSLFHTGFGGEINHFQAGGPADGKQALALQESFVRRGDPPPNRDGHAEHSPHHNHARPAPDRSQESTGRSSSPLPGVSPSPHMRRARETVSAQPDGAPNQSHFRSCRPFHVSRT